MGIFGSDYPPGCHSTPYDEDPAQDNTILKDAFKDCDSLTDLYRTTYREYSCGPTVSATVRVWAVEQIGEGPCAGEVFEFEKDLEYTNEDLSKLGTWKDMDHAGALVISIQVSSIVEGSEGEVPPIVLCLEEYWEDEDGARLLADWDAACQSVEVDAEVLWLDGLLD